MMILQSNLTLITKASTSTFTNIIKKEGYVQGACSEIACREECSHVPHQRAKYLF